MVGVVWSEWFMGIAEIIMGCWFTLMGISFKIGVAGDLFVF